jgi:hypothetical protein
MLIANYDPIFIYLFIYFHTHIACLYSTWWSKTIINQNKNRIYSEVTSKIQVNGPNWSYDIVL